MLISNFLIIKLTKIKFNVKVPDDLDGERVWRNLQDRNDPTF
jgi:hypothetical protein